MKDEGAGNAKRQTPLPFELGMEAIKALKPPHQDFFVAYALLRPTLQNLVNTESFDAMEPVIFQIGVVNDFGQANHGSLANTKTFNQSFERAAGAVSTKLRIYHIVRQCSGMFRRRLGKDEFGFRIDEVVN